MEYWALSTLWGNKYPVTIVEVTIVEFLLVNEIKQQKYEVF